jgi:RNA polymerase sigma-70 factor (ECF subfamily)
LAPRDRAILTLHYQEGRSYEEIAAILDAPLGTVKTNLYRARERLKAIMKESTATCRTPC